MRLRALTEFIDTGIHILVDKSIKDTEKGIYILLYLYKEIASVFQRGFDCMKRSIHIRKIYVGMYKFVLYTGNHCFFK